MAEGRRMMMNLAGSSRVAGTVIVSSHAGQKNGKQTIKINGKTVLSKSDIVYRNSGSHAIEKCELSAP